MNRLFFNNIKGLVLVALLILNGCDNKDNLPADFNITGLWCRGENGVCDRAFKNLYLFGQAFTPLLVQQNNDKLKYYAIVKPPMNYDGISIAYDWTNPGESNLPPIRDKNDLHNIAIRNAEKKVKDPISPIPYYPIPIRHIISYFGYDFNSTESSITYNKVSNNNNFLIKSDCLTKLNLILETQTPVFRHYQNVAYNFLRHRHEPSRAFTIVQQQFNLSYESAKEYCDDKWADLHDYDHDFLKNSQFARELKPGQKIRSHSIQYISDTDIEFSAIKEKDEQDYRGRGWYEANMPSGRFTRVPLSKLMQLIPFANESEINDIIWKLGLTEAMNKSLAESAAPSFQAASLSEQDILTSLFGNYDAHNKRAISEHFALPVNADGFANDPITAETKILMVSPVNYESEKHQLVVLVSQEADRDHTCNACAPIIGAALFKSESGKWNAIAFNPSIDWIGRIGNAPKPTIQSAGASWILRFDTKSGAQGFEYMTTTLISLIPGEDDNLKKFHRFVKLLDLQTYSDSYGHYDECTDETICEHFETKLEFVKPEGVSPIHDIIARTDGYKEKSHGKRESFSMVDYYTYSGRGYERDVIKSAKFNKK